jgi:hypothetical protein
MTDNTTASATRTQALTEDLGMRDNITTVFTKPLSEKLGISDNTSFNGEIRIEARDISGILIDKIATYTIKPNPFGGDSLIITDGGFNDKDNTVGRVAFGPAPFGTYNVTMTTIPAGYNVLGNSTLHEVHYTQVNGISTFRVVSTGTNLAMIPVTVITSSPSLNSTTFDTWTKTYSATIVNGTTTYTISKVQDLPPIISVGKQRTELLDTAITKQASVKLNLSFNSLTSGQFIINKIGAKNYTIPESPQIISVIPSIVTVPSGSSPQFITTPPLNKIMAGQIMVVPVESALLSSWGGVKQLMVHSKDGTSQVGNPPDDWFVIESAPIIPSSVGTNGISQDKINLFVDVKYRHEEDGQGFDWSKPSNHATKPILKVRIAKSDSLVSYSNGCPVLTGYTFDNTLHIWKQQDIILSNPVSIDANTCELDMTVDHFSRFSLSSSQKTTGGGLVPNGVISSGGGGGGGGAASSTQTGFGGRLVQPIIIYEISYDTCEQNTIRIIVGTVGSEAHPPNVKIRTPQKEVYSATLAQDQPYIDANKILPISRYVYEAKLDPKLNFFIVTAEQTSGRTAVATSYTASIDGCRNTIIVNPMKDLETAGGLEPTLEKGVPNIFDIKFQVNDNKPIKATTINQFVEPDSQLSVSAIVDSPSTIRRAELRVNIATGNYSNYAAIKMNVVPLANITNAYVISAKLPTSFLQAPAIVYWIHIINNEEKTQSSEKYFLGVKPTYKLDARMELDSTPSKAEGTTYRPTAYVYNKAEKPFFGSVSLIVNNTVVYTSPEQLFKKGQSVVNLEWSIPEAESESKYLVKAQLNLYDHSINTAQTILNTFQGTKIYPISEPIQASSIIDNGEMVARVGLLYSSNNNQDIHYKVTAPDGTCVIGKSDSCAVKDSTAGHRGNTISVEIGGQIFRVRYSGQNSPLERFSITSIDPIVGSWHVTLESDNGMMPEAHAIDDVHLKVKYRSTFTKLVTVASD